MDRGRRKTTTSTSATTTPTKNKGTSSKTNTPKSKTNTPKTGTPKTTGATPKSKTTTPKITPTPNVKTAKISPMPQRTSTTTTTPKIATITPKTKGTTPKTTGTTPKTILKGTTPKTTSRGTTPTYNNNNNNNNNNKNNIANTNNPFLPTPPSVKITEEENDDNNNNNNNNDNKNDSAASGGGGGSGGSGGVGISGIDGIDNKDKDKDKNKEEKEEDIMHKLLLAPPKHQIKILLNLLGGYGHNFTVVSKFFGNEVAAHVMSGRISWKELWFAPKWSSEFKRRMNEVMNWKMAYSIRHMVRVYLRDHVHSIVARTMIRNPKTAPLPHYKFSVTAEMAVEHLSQINPQDWLPRLPFEKREEMLIHLRNELINPLIAQLSETLPYKYQFHRLYNQKHLVDNNGSELNESEKENQTEEEKKLEQDRWQKWGDYGLLNKEATGAMLEEKMNINLGIKQARIDILSHQTKDIQHTLFAEKGEHYATFYSETKVRLWQDARIKEKEKIQEALKKLELQYEDRFTRLQIQANHVQSDLGFSQKTTQQLRETVETMMREYVEIKRQLFEQQSLIKHQDIKRAHFLRSATDQWQSEQRHKQRMETFRRRIHALMQDIATLRGELASYETHYSVQKLYELRTKVNEEENKALSKLAHIRDTEKKISTLKQKIEEILDQEKGQIKKHKMQTIVIS